MHHESVLACGKCVFLEGLCIDRPPVCGVVCVCVSVCVCECVCVWCGVCVYVCVVCVCVRTRVCVHVCGTSVHASVCVYMCLLASLCVCYKSECLCVGCEAVYVLSGQLYSWACNVCKLIHTLISSPTME